MQAIEFKDNVVAIPKIDIQLVVNELNRMNEQQGRQVSKPSEIALHLFTHYRLMTVPTKSGRQCRLLQNPSGIVRTISFYCWYAFCKLFGKIRPIRLDEARSVLYNAQQCDLLQRIVIQLFPSLAQEPCPGGDGQTNVSRSEYAIQQGKTRPGSALVVQKTGIVEISRQECAKFFGSIDLTRCSVRSAICVVCANIPNTGSCPCHIEVSRSAAALLDISNNTIQYRRLTQVLMSSLTQSAYKRYQTLIILAPLFTALEPLQAIKQQTESVFSSIVTVMSQYDLPDSVRNYLQALCDDYTKWTKATLTDCMRQIPWFLSAQYRQYMDALQKEQALAGQYMLQNCCELLVPKTLTGLSQYRLIVETLAQEIVCQPDLIPTYMKSPLGAYVRDMYVYLQWVCKWLPTTGSFGIGYAVCQTPIQQYVQKIFDAIMPSVKKPDELRANLEIRRVKLQDSIEAEENVCAYDMLRKHLSRIRRDHTVAIRQMVMCILTNPHLCSITNEIAQVMASLIELKEAKIAHVSEACQEALTTRNFDPHSMREVLEHKDWLLTHATTCLNIIEQYRQEQARICLCPAYHIGDIISWTAWKRTIEELVTKIQEWRVVIQNIEFLRAFATTVRDNQGLHAFLTRLNTLLRLVVDKQACVRLSVAERQTYVHDISLYIKIVKQLQTLLQQKESLIQTLPTTIHTIAEYGQAVQDLVEWYEGKIQATCQQSLADMKATSIPLECLRTQVEKVSANQAWSQDPLAWKQHKLAVQECRAVFDSLCEFSTRFQAIHNGRQLRASLFVKQFTFHKEFEYPIIMEQLDAAVMILKKQQELEKLYVLAKELYAFVTQDTLENVKNRTWPVWMSQELTQATEAAISDLHQDSRKRFLVQQYMMPLQQVYADMHDLLYGQDLRYVYRERPVIGSTVVADNGKTPGRLNEARFQHVQSALGTMLQRALHTQGKPVYMRSQLSRVPDGPVGGLELVQISDAMDCVQYLLRIVCLEIVLGSTDEQAVPLIPQQISSLAHYALILDNMQKYGAYRCGDLMKWNICAAQIFDDKIREDSTLFRWSLKATGRLAHDIDNSVQKAENVLFTHVQSLCLPLGDDSSVDDAASDDESRWERQEDFL